MKNKLVFCCILISVVFMVSCEKEDPSNNEILNIPITTDDLSGFGDRPGTPSGVLFHLPYNVQFSTQLLGRDTGYWNYPQYGIGTIGAIFTLANNNNLPVEVVFPAGLIFLADNDSSQNGLTAYPSTIYLPSMSTKRMVLRFFCMNHNKNAGYVNFYTMNVISNNDQVTTLTNLTRYKNDSIINSHTWNLQQIIWNISDGNGLTQADKDMIRGW